MSINLYPPSVHNGSYTAPTPGKDIDDICHEIHAATKGFGTNERRLLKALGGCDADQRCKVPARYYQLYGKALIDLMKSECGSRVFGRALQYLAVDPLHADCDMIEDACQGIGTHEILLFSILCGRSNDEIALLKKKYQDLKNRDLLRVLCRETSGNVENLFKWLLKGAEEKYDPKIHTEAKMEQDAEKIRAMGEGRLGTNEDGIFRLLCTSPPQHLRGIDSKYQAKYGKDLVSAMKWEMSGIVEKGTLMLLQMKLNPHEQVARMIHDTVKGIGTNELLLTTHLIRYQPIMKEVNMAYERMYKQSVQRAVKNDTSGDFERLLIEIIEA